MRKIYILALSRASEDGGLFGMPRTALFNSMHEAKSEISRLMDELKDQDDEWHGHILYESEKRLEYYAALGGMCEMGITIQEYEI